MCWTSLLTVEDPSCVDFFGWCRLVPQHGVCNHKFYGKECCKSCSRKSWSGRPPSWQGQGLTSQPPERPAPFPSKAEPCRPCEPTAVLEGLLSRIACLFISLTHMVLRSTWKWEAMTNRTHRSIEQKQTGFALHCYRKEVIGLPWERTGLNFDQGRCLWTLGTDPTPGNLRRWVLEMSFRTSSHGLRLGVIRCGEHAA